MVASVNDDGLDPKIARYFRTGMRVRVLNTRTGAVRTGRISRSCGTAPVYLLMSRAGDDWSDDVLGRHDIVVAVQNRHGNYV